MSEATRVFNLPEELSQALDTLKLSVSPTGLPDSRASWYAFAFDGGQDDELNAFGSSSTEAVTKLIEKLNSGLPRPAETSDTPLR